MMTHVANILDEIHTGLDPRVWNDPESDEPTLKPQHADFIKHAIYSALEQNGYARPKTWLHLVLTGSTTTYQFSDDSDVDVSLFIDSEIFPEWSRAEMIAIMIDHVDGKKLPGTPFPLQDYVVPAHIKPADLYRKGLRSGWDIDQQRWIVPPERDRVHDVQAQENGFYVWALQAADKMERLLRYEPEKAKTYWHQLHERRRNDMAKGKGDFAESNVVYKFLANRNLFPAISEATGEYLASASPHGSSSTVPFSTRVAYDAWWSGEQEPVTVYRGLHLGQTDEQGLAALRNNPLQYWQAHGMRQQNPGSHWTADLGVAREYALNRMGEWYENDPNEHQPYAHGVVLQAQVHPNRLEAPYDEMAGEEDQEAMLHDAQFSDLTDIYGVHEKPEGGIAQMHQSVDATAMPAPVSRPQPTLRPKPPGWEEAQAKARAEYLAKTAWDLTSINRSANFTSVSHQDDYQNEMKRRWSSLPLYLESLEEEAAKTAAGEEPVEPFQEVPGATFHQHFQQALAHPTFGKYLTPHSPEEFAQMRTFIHPSGLVGGALQYHPDGRIEAGSLFNAGGPRGAGMKMMQHLIGQGANYLSAIGDPLRQKYEGQGFQTTNAMSWDDQYAPDNWDYENQGRPNVYEMSLGSQPSGQSFT
jgi:hypothetical protein